MISHHQLQRLWHRGCKFLGTDYAILGGAMTWVSERNLVSALSNAGGFGVLACGAMPPELLAEEIKATQALTAKPFGVNLIVMHPRLAELIQVCIDGRISHVVLAGGLAARSDIATLKAAGIKVMAFAPSYAVAVKLERSGVDALIIEGMEAGGHIGSVSTSVLAQEILTHPLDIPVFVAGGIGHGEAMVNYLQMGAAGCQLGTMFVCATESRAHANFKQAFLRAHARDAVPSVQLDPRFPVIPVRALANAASADFLAKQRELIGQVDAGQLALKEAQLEIEHYWAGALRRAVIDGDIDRGSIMAGQSVGMVKKEQPVAEILAELLDQASAALSHRQDFYVSKPASSTRVTC